MSRWGVTYDLVDQTDLAAVERAVRDDTRLIWVESPTNPFLNVVDIEGVVARRRDALVARRQHVRDAGEPAPARARRRLRRALHHQVPRRPF